MTLVDLCAGALAVTLAAVAGGPARPLTAYLGGKARVSTGILAALEVITRPRRILLCDPGPWGRVWKVLAGLGLWHDVAGHIRSLDRMSAKGPELFGNIASAPPPADPVLWTARFLALQSAAARGRPVIPLETCWKTPGYAHLSASAIAKGFTERLRPDQLAVRVEAMGRLPWPEVRVHHGRAQDVPVEPGSVVYLDPPWEGTTGYDNEFPPAEVREVATRWRAAGCRVGVSEGRPLPWSGWHVMRLTPSRGGSRLGSPEEWLTLSHRPGGQLGLDLGGWRP